MNKTRAQRTRALTLKKEWLTIHNIQTFSIIMLVSFVISLIEINVHGQTVDLIGYYK